MEKYFNEIFIINDLNKVGGSENSIKKISEKFNCKLIDLQSLNCNSRNIIYDVFVLYKNIKNTSILNVFLEYTTILCLIIKIFKKDLIINVWIRTSAKHRFGRRNEFIYRILLRYSDKLIFQTDCQREEFIKKYPFIIKMKYSFFQEERHYPTNGEYLIDNKIYFYAGRLENEKGILEIINWSKKNQKTLLIYGYGSLRSKIISITKNNNNIFYLGGYKSFFSLPLYGNLIINSNYEGNPNVLYEAMHININILCRKFNDCIERQNTYKKIQFFDNINQL